MTVGSTRVDVGQDVREVLDEAPHGYLALNSPTGWPVVRPVNFVFHAGRVYYHGSSEGEKMDLIERDPRSTFVVVTDFSIIPSYFVHPRNACPATQYYKAVLIEGVTRVVTERAEKAAALQALMEKLQPDGGYEPITAEGSSYRKSLSTTAVLALEIHRISSKFSLGQRASGEKRRGIESGLAQRGCPIDHATLESMQKFRERPVVIDSRRDDPPR